MSSLAELNNAIDGSLSRMEEPRDAVDVPLGSIVTDSRQIEPGDTFWALRGPHHDGANFVAEAFRRGAVAAVVNRQSTTPAGHWIVRVADTAAALNRWATWRRRQFTGTLIGVTGSVGKTTTRQMIHTILRSRLKGTASPRNFNNHVGLPLSMARLEPDHDYAVLELGANRSGEIAALAKLCRPKVGVITRVGDAHLGGFGTRQGIAQAKAELLAALPTDGRAVLGDDPWLRTVAANCTARITWVGTSENCDVRATDVYSDQGQLQFRIVLGENSGQRRDQRFNIPLWGRHHLTSALAAIAVGRMFGFDLEEMADVLEDFQPLPMRCEVKEIRGATVINDTYNSSPTAMRAALTLVGDLDTSGRRIVVCGDMAELGNKSAALHWRMGKDAVTLGRVDLLIACGRYARQVVAGARAAGLPTARAIACKDTAESEPYLGQAIQPGDVVLVKGSRSMAMERVVEALENYPKRRSA